jgi:putative RecB family exonuclease
VWQVHDYKTNKLRCRPRKRKDRDPQLAFYEIGIRQMWPDAERVELYWHFLRHDQTIKSTRTPAQLEDLRRETVDLIERIEGCAPVEKAFPTKESALCNYCDFQHVCPVRKHLHEVQSLPRNRFAKESGVKLVDHWTELQAQRQKLIEKQRVIEAEIAELQEALLALAEKKGLSTVVGSEKEVAVTTSESVEFPTKTAQPEEAAALEAKLRASKWWPEVSSLDRFALKRLWEQREQLQASLRNTLEKFATVESQISIRLRNRRDGAR